ncbi:hypothetical protein [Ectobacillus panaciterrae]|uniref:hypothetical protein n=1 Tax=Ectobacillus panaciterrae TaxID=363872 RepID=UPI0003FDA703|nr:hypothetical protein [Ectobacillus panaciterrae]
MEDLFSYVISYVFLILFVIGALLLFPFFPRLALLLTIICMFGVSIVISLLPEKQKENGVEQMKA